MRPEIITALDVPNSSEMESLLDALPSDLKWYKVGLEAFCAEGPEILNPLKSRGNQIFLDLKLHDIPRTVSRAVRAAARHGVGMLTLHASGGRDMLQAAADSAAEMGAERPKLLAATVLTSLDNSDLSELGIKRSVGEQVKELAKMAIEAGMDGLVCSPGEAAQLRLVIGPKPLLVTPGIRLPSAADDDQKRKSSPREAADAGASHLVIGRPITQAEDPRKALAAIQANIAGTE